MNSFDLGTSWSIISESNELINRIIKGLIKHNFYSRLDNISNGKNKIYIECDWHSLPEWNYCNSSYHKNYCNSNTTNIISQVKSTWGCYLQCICDLDFLFKSDYQKYVTNLNNYMYLVVFFFYHACVNFNYFFPWWISIIYLIDNAIFKW